MCKTKREAMTITLKVPYYEKEQAKLLGARWNQDKKHWYVPDGMLATPFECWIDEPFNQSKSQPKKPRNARRKGVKSKVLIGPLGTPIVGAKYFDIGHRCCPWEYCAECAPKLSAAGW